MKIEMLKTAPGSDNGIVVRAYEAGAIETVSDALGDCFIRMGVAKRVDDSTPETPKKPAKPAAKQTKVKAPAETKPAPAAASGGESTDESTDLEGDPSAGDAGPS